MRMLKLVVFLFSFGLVLGAPSVKHTPPLDGRIVGGKDADVADYPYQISLLYDGYQHCGGAIISSKWIVTAAHCVDYTHPDFEVRAGTSEAESGGEVYEIAQITIHPLFDPNLDYDIALLQLSSDISTPNTSAINLPELNIKDTTIPENATAVVTGWGDTDEDGTMPNVLQVVEVPVITQKDCRDAYGVSNVTDRMFCAGFIETGGKDACFGDSGGPVAINGVLTGLVSWGVGCAEPNRPGVYTNVLALRGWINEITGL